MSLRLIWNSKDTLPAEYFYVHKLYECDIIKKTAIGGIFMIDRQKFYGNSLLLDEINYKEGYIEAEVYSLTKQPIHFHKDIEIFMVLEGTADIKVCFTTFSLNEGEFAIINMGDLHSVQKVGEKTVAASVHFDDSIYSVNDSLVMWDIENIKKSPEIYEKIKENVLNILQAKFIEKSEQAMEKYGSSIKKAFKNNLRLVSRRIASDKEANKENSIFFERLDKVCEFLYSHFDEHITLESTAKEMNLSKYYLSHFMTEGLGLSFKSMLNLVRVDRAELSVLEGQTPINEICYEMGFSSMEYFNKYFKQYFGCTPAEHRKKFMKETLRYEDFLQIPYEITEEELKKLRGFDTEKGNSAIKIKLNNIPVQAVVITDDRGRMISNTINIRENEEPALYFDGTEMVVIIKKQES